MAFMEVKTTDNQTVYLDPHQIAALEEVPSSARVEGHLKVFAAGFKWLVQAELSEFIAEIEKARKN